MSRIRSVGTKPEKTVRKMLRGMTDLPLKLNVSNMIGKPDIAIIPLRLAIFVDGCFWHGCPKHCNILKSNNGYWVPKIVGNMLRDEEVTVALEESGWTVMRIWEHDLTPDSVANVRKRLARKLSRLLSTSR